MPAERKSKRATDPVNCPICGKQISRLADLPRHVKVHTREDLFHCTWPNCNFSAIQQTNLASHMNRHTKQRPHKCPEGNCKAKFPCPSALTRHRQKRHGRKSKRSSEEENPEVVPEPTLENTTSTRGRRHRQESAPFSEEEEEEGEPVASSSSLRLPTEEQAQTDIQAAFASYDIRVGEIAAQSHGGSSSSWGPSAFLPPARAGVEGGQVPPTQDYQASWDAFLRQIAPPAGANQILYPSGTVVDNTIQGVSQSSQVAQSASTLPPAGSTPEGVQTALASYTAEEAIDSFVQAASRSSWDPFPSLPLPPTFDQGSQVDEESAQAQSLSGSFPSMDLFPPSRSFSNEQVPAGDEVAVVPYHQETTAAPFNSIRQRHSYARRPAMPLAPVASMSLTDDAWNNFLDIYDDSFTDTVPISYGTGSASVSVPAVNPPYAFAEMGAITPAAIPRYGNRHDRSTLLPSSTLFPSYVVNDVNSYHVGSVPLPAPMSSSSYGSLYTTNGASHGNHDYPLNARQSQRPFPNPSLNMNGYSYAAHAGPSRLGNDGFHQK